MKASALCASDATSFSDIPRILGSLRGYDGLCASKKNAPRRRFVPAFRANDEQALAHAGRADAANSAVLEIGMTVYPMCDETMLALRLWHAEIGRVLRHKVGCDRACYLTSIWRQRDALLTERGAAMLLPESALTKGEIYDAGASDETHRILCVTSRAVSDCLECIMPEDVRAYLRLRANRKVYGRLDRMARLLGA